MRQINITREGGKVTFETVSIDSTENVCFTNMDTESAHWPTISANQLGPFPSPNSSQCTVTPPAGGKPPFKFTYKGQIKGHEAEQGGINGFAPLAAVALKPAAKGQPTNQQAVSGGMSPYTITGQLFQVKDANGNVIQQGSGGIGPGLQLDAASDNKGVWVVGTPTLSGTYNFTFNVDDGMGRNLQQTQYSITVA